jgi:hypothetical protein
MIAKLRWQLLEHPRDGLEASHRSFTIIVGMVAKPRLRLEDHRLYAFEPSS